MKILSRPKKGVSNMFLGTLQKGLLRRAGSLWIVGLAILLTSTQSVAAKGKRSSESEISFAIAAQPLNSALKDFADQSRFQVLYSSETVENMETGGVRGTLRPTVAIVELLADTGLNYRFDGRDTMVVARDSSEIEESRARQDPAPAEEDEPDAAPQEETAPLAEEQTATFGEAIKVTGSNIPQIQQETALPVSTLGEEEMLLREAGTVTELLEYLPQASGLDNQEGSTGPNDARGDASSVNLRGLGSGSTLVLLNGRRLPPHPISSGAVPRLTVNVNTIPSRALERVEVLRDGASAVYGTDASAGVVNAITKSSIDSRFEVSARYGGDDDGALQETSLSFAAGFRPNSGKTQIFLYGDGFDRDGLLAGDRDFASETDLRDRSGSTSTRWDNSSVNTPHGRFRTGTANPDGSFSSARLPGAPDDDFYIDGGVVFGSLPRDLRFNFAPFRFLIPDTERYNFYTTVEHSARDNLTLFGNLALYRADSLTASAPVAISGSSNNDIFVPSQNFYNPFRGQADVLIRNYRPVELGNRTAEVETTSYRLLGGARGFFAGNWAWESALTYGDAETVDIAGNMLSESRLREQLALDTPDAWNAFGSNPQEVLDRVRINPRREGNTTLALLDTSFTGLLRELPGGPLYIAAGAELRREEFTDRRDAFSNGDDVIAQSQTSNTDGDRDVTSAFVELSVPLLADKPGFHSLELSLAGRFEDFSDFGNTTKPKFGLSWYPVNWILVRGSYSEGFKAPNLAQLFTGEIPRRTEGVQDPYRSEVTATPADLGDVSREIIRGGNVNLRPEESETKTAGLVIQSPGSGSFFVSLDYWEIEQSDRIDVFGHQDQLALDFLLRSTGQGLNSDVVRAAPTAADIAAFDAFNAANPGSQRAAAGEILFVRDTFFNLTGRTVSGWDLGFNLRTKESKIGRFTFKSELTYYDQFDERKDADSPNESQLKVNGNPRFRGNAGVTWRKGNYGSGLFSSYVSEFIDTSAPAADGGDFLVEDWTVFNTYFSYTLGNGLNLRLSVNNLFDEDPPLADEIRGFFNRYHSPRGRTAFISAKMGF